MTAPERLKLRAEDEADLQVLGACLQDALAPLGDMIWLRDEGRFAMVVNRFMWEAPPEQVDPGGEAAPGEVHSRTHGILSIHHVRSVQVRGIDQRDRDRILCLLAVRTGEGRIDLDFAGGGSIRIAVDRIDCFLEDVGAPWPTRWRPAHSDEDGAPGE